MTSATAAIAWQPPRAKQRKKLNGPTLGDIDPLDALSACLPAARIERPRVTGRARRRWISGSVRRGVLGGKTAVVGLHGKSLRP